jgi:hypothetical protein
MTSRGFHGTDEAVSEGEKVATMSKGTPYAEATTVSVVNSRAELEAMLKRYGATHTAIFNEPGRTMIAFRMAERNVRITLPLPDKSAREFTHATFGARGEQKRNPEAQQTAWEKACRQKWRSLVLAVKAKLVSVADGIETFEEAFMAHVVMPDGRTVAETITPNIALAYEQGGHVPLLPSPRLQ